jgi:hypothetical protein
VAHSKEDPFIHSHNADDFRFKEKYDGKLTYKKHAKKMSKSGSAGRSIIMLKTEQRKSKR